MTNTVPHFAFPFSFGPTGHVAVVDQDTLQDVVTCVNVVLLTFQGQRLELPDFGISDPTFENQPIDLQAIAEQVLLQEPRAVLVLEQHPDALYSLVADVIARVSISQEVTRSV